jgi:hypothetical protein
MTRWSDSSLETMGRHLMRGTDVSDGMKRKFAEIIIGQADPKVQFKLIGAAKEWLDNHPEQ